MALSSHRRAIRCAPSYAPPRLDTRGTRNPHLTHQFPRRFRAARVGRRNLTFDAPSRDAAAAIPPLARTQRPTAVCAASTIFAVALVANLAAASARATPAVPAGIDRPALGERASDDVLPARANAFGHIDIDVAPIHAPVIKTDYPVSDVLRALASADAPFRNLGKTLGDAYAVLSGNDVAPRTRQTIMQVGAFMDLATGLVPAVQRMRVGAQVADVSADAVEHNHVDTDGITGIVQVADPRAMSAGASRQTGRGALPAPHRVAARPDALPDSRSDVVRAAPAERRDAVGATRDARPHVGNTPGVDADTPFRIAGEHEHLSGYAQALPPGVAPGTPRQRLILAAGRYYLAGEAGYYHATRGRSADHWLVEAPRGADRRAPVPVHYDADTGQWRAEAPLRLCGGGCAPSREATPDSIALDHDRVASALAHLPDENIREGIQRAFADLSLLHLTRSNRPDLHMMRDNSIVDHRAALRAAMKHIKPGASLVRQQQAASLITAMHYYWHPDAEAFCQENAEILFHYLLVNDVPIDRIRMITIQPKNRPPHVLVLYTESETLIPLLDAATPQPPVGARPDGIRDGVFAREIYESRDTTLLLDPWSHARATSFFHANHAISLVETLDAAFVDIGHRPGSDYTVSITRPLGTPRASVVSLSGGDNRETQGSWDSLESDRRSGHPDGSGRSGSGSSLSGGSSAPAARDSGREGAILP